MRILQLRVSTSTGRSITPDENGNISLEPKEKIVLTGASFGEEQPNRSVKWIAELPVGQLDAELGRFIPWLNPAFAFTALMVSNAVRPEHSHPMDGGDGTLASSLYHLVKQKENEKGEATWLQYLFGVAAGSNEVERRYLKATHNGSQKTYKVELRPDVLQNVRLVFLSGEHTLPSICYSSLAEHFLRLFKPRAHGARDDKSQILDVLVYDWDQADYVSIRDAGFVCYRSALKIVIRPELPEYFYLAWINSRGEDHSLHPFADLQWAPPVREAPLEQKLILPLAPDENAPQAYYIDTPRGLETIVLLQRDSPLSATDIQRVQNEIKRLGGMRPGQPPNAPSERHWSGPKLTPTDSPKLIQGLAPEGGAVGLFLEELIKCLKPFAARIAILGIPNEGVRPA